MAGALALAAAGCGGGGEKGGSPGSPSTTRPSATAPASTATNRESSPPGGRAQARFQTVRGCLDRAGLDTSEAVPQGASSKGILVSPGTDIYFYPSPEDARADLAAIRRKEGSGKQVSAVGDAVVSYDTVLVSGQRGRATRAAVSRCL